MNGRKFDEERIFQLARKQPDADSRSEYLDQICNGDSALRRRVEALLAADGQETDFLKSNHQLAKTAASKTQSNSNARQIGPYKIREQIGEGGMGIVYVAEQQSPVRRKVALKIIKPGMDSKEVVARFKAERQALAMMDHPGIAKVFDGGVTDAGQSYFAMELINGIPITQYCDEQKLGIRERLDLFVSVCNAVQHAHQKGVIHRDIKPSNVLVTLHDGKPVPVIIDFGVAKATNQNLSDQTIYTRLHQVVGTTLYMSPEQAELSRFGVDTRTDIYSLGVLLYELLSGTTPFDRERFKQAALDEVRRIIREEEPPKPSTRLSTLGDTATKVSSLRRTDPHKLRHSLRGDLDWIVMMALEKDRNRRYETANGLGMDVTRFLNDEPVLARPPSTIYRIQKFYLRNKALATTSLFVVLALTVGFATALWGLKKAADEAISNKRANDRLKLESSRLVAKTNVLQSNLAFEAWNDGTLVEFRERFRDLQKSSTTKQKTLFDYRLLESLFRNTFDDIEEYQVGEIITSISHFDDGKGNARRIAIALAGGRCAIHDPGKSSDPKEFCRLPHHCRLEYSNDGTKLLVSTARIKDQVTPSTAIVRVYEVSDVGEPIFPPREVRGLCAASFSPDSQLIAAVGEENITVLTPELKVKREIPCKLDGAAKMNFTSDGKLLAVGDWNGLAAIWDLESDSDQPVFKKQLLRWTDVIEFSPNDDWLVLDSTYGARLFQREGGNFEETEIVFDVPGLCCDFSPDGKYMALGTSDHKVRIYETDDFQEVARLLVGAAVSDLEFAPDGQSLSAGGRDEILRTWDSRHWRRRFVKSAVHHHLPLDASPRDQTVIFTREKSGFDRYPEPVISIPGRSIDPEFPGSGGPVELIEWNLKNGELRPVAENNQLIRSARYSPNGKLIAAGDDTGAIWLWQREIDRQTGRLVWQEVFRKKARLDEKEESVRVRDLVFHGNHCLFSGHANGSVVRWDLQQKVQVQELQGPAGQLWCLANSQTGILAAGGGREGQGQSVFWQIGDAVAAQTIEPSKRSRWQLSHAQFVRSISFPRKAETKTKIAMTEDFDAGKFVIMDAKTGAISAQFTGHSSKSMPCLLDSSGTRLITGSDDGTVKFWDCETGELRGTLDVGERIRGLVLLNNETLVVGSREGYTRVYGKLPTSAAGE